MSPILQSLLMSICLAQNETKCGLSTLTAALWCLTTEVLLTLSGPHAQHVEPGGEATGDGEVANLDKAAPLVILDYNSAHHSLELERELYRHD